MAKPGREVPTEDEPQDELESGNSTDIRAVSRAAQILGLFSPTQPQLTTTFVATRLKMNRTTAYRYCMSLVTAKLLERTDGSEFVPGPILLQLGAFALGRRDILGIAPPHMRALSATADATAVLSLWGSTGPIVSAVEEDTRRNVLVTVRLGTHLHMTTAQARLFHAFHPDQLLMGRLLANLPEPEHEQLVTQIAEARAAGYAVQLSKRGITIVAAPVFDDRGMCAALALLATRDVLSTNRDSAQVSALIDTARELTREMGGKPLD